MFSLRRSLLQSFLVALAVWPAIHFALYLQYGIEPWRLAGWAMYARPPAVRQIDLFRLDGGVATRIRSLDLAAARELRELGEWRGVLGELVSPDLLAEALLEEHPDSEGIRIVLRRIDLDPSTGTFDRVREETYERFR